MASQAALQDLLGVSEMDESGSRKRRSLDEQESQAAESSQHDLLKRSRRSAEGEASSDLENKDLAKRDADMAGGENEVQKHDLKKRFMRFGKSSSDFNDLADKRFIRFGKRFMRFGRPGQTPDKRFMRFGRSFDDFADKRFIRFGKRADQAGEFSDKRFVRFGRAYLGDLSDTADKRFIRFGRKFDKLGDKRFMRFGRSTREETDSETPLTQKS